MNGIYFAASPAYLNIYSYPTSDLDLENHHCITYGRADGTVSPWRFSDTQSGEIERRMMASRMVVGDGEAQVTAVLAGCGIAQLPTWLVNHHLNEGALVEVLPHLANDGLAINLVWIKSRQTLPKVSLLLKALTSNLLSSISKSQ